MTVGSNPEARPEDAAVAEVEGRIVGFALAGIMRSTAPELSPLYGRTALQAVLVAPAWWRRGIGRRLVTAVAAGGATVGAERIVAGGGLFYFWPGVPDNLPAAGPFLTALGFEFDNEPSYDLRGDIAMLRPGDAPAVLERAGLALEPAGPGDRGALLAFLLAEFGPDWWHDVGWYLDAGGDPNDVLLLRSGDGRIHGFVRIHTPASRPPGWPMYWRGDRPDAGGLGPIGLARADRGRGLGRALLVVALDRLRRLGATDVVIDDTSLLGYYGPHGFAPWIVYRHASAPLGRLVDGPAVSHQEVR